MNQPFLNTPFGSLGTELWKPNLYIWVFFFESSIKFLLVTKTFASCKVFIYVLLYSHVCLFKNLPTEIIISKNVWWSVSVVLTFPFLGAGFANISPTFLISCEVQTKYSKILKYSEQYIREHLSGTKVRIWICSEYDAVFNFSCIASCNLTKTFTFFCMSFLS